MIKEILPIKKDNGVEVFYEDLIDKINEIIEVVNKLKNE